MSLESPNETLHELNSMQKSPNETLHELNSMQKFQVSKLISLKHMLYG